MAGTARRVQISGLVRVTVHIVPEEFCRKYLRGALPGLQLSALLLQGGNLFVLRQQQVGVLGEVTSSLAGERPLALLHGPGPQQRRGVHLHKGREGVCIRTHFLFVR